MRGGAKKRDTKCTISVWSLTHRTTLSPTNINIEVELSRLKKVELYVIYEVNNAELAKAVPKVFSESQDSSSYS